MNINYNDLFKVSVPYVILFLFAFIVNGILFFFLPKNGVDYMERPTYEFRSYKMDAFFDKKNNKPLRNNTPTQYALLSNLVLNAIYAKSDGSGWIVVKEKNAVKTHVLSQSQNFKGYQLKVLFSNYVIFEKNAKEYKLALPKSKKKFSIAQNNVSLHNSITANGKRIKVQREILNAYTNNLSKIWNAVRIDEVTRKGNLTGFRVSKIKKNSIIEKLGLKEGDILHKANGAKLNNYNAALKLYKDIKSLNKLNLGIVRNNRKMELNYEIN